MTYVLYGDRCSGAAAIECALAEIGAPYELRTIALEAEQQRTADYATINPQRKLPTLIMPNGDVTTESAAILITLDERHPDAGLLPREPSERARALRWLVFIAAELYPLVEIIDYPERFVGNAAAIDDVRDTARQLWRARWLVLEAEIAGAPWLLASGFSAVDLYIAVVSRWGQQTEWRPAHIPKVEALTAAVAARPAAGPALCRHWPQLTA